MSASKPVVQSGYKFTGTKIAEEGGNYYHHITPKIEDEPRFRLSLKSDSDKQDDELKTLKDEIPKIFSEAVNTAMENNGMTNLQTVVRMLLVARECGGVGSKEEAFKTKYNRTYGVTLSSEEFQQIKKVSADIQKELGKKQIMTGRTSEEGLVKIVPARSSRMATAKNIAYFLEQQPKKACNIIEAKSDLFAISSSVAQYPVAR